MDLLDPQGPCLKAHAFYLAQRLPRPLMEAYLNIWGLTLIEFDRHHSTGSVLFVLWAGRLHSLSVFLIHCPVGGAKESRPRGRQAGRQLERRGDLPGWEPGSSGAS